METFLASLVCRLNTVILLRQAHMTYSIYGNVPDFYKKLFPCTQDGVCTEPWKHSYMLEFFIDSAESFFETNSEGEITSGIWQEDRGDSQNLFFAGAMYLDGRQMVFIRELTEDFPEHITMMQKVREGILQQKRISKSLNFYKNKSSFDELTSLYNKGTFIEIFKEELKNGSDAYESAVLMIDIDHFKVVNDNYGHLEGDRVLSALGKLLTTILRSNDIAARFGGEEFVVFIPGTDAEKMYKIAEKIRSRVEKHNFEPVPKVTISIGCAMCKHDDDADDCIERADQALYDAKRAGRNKVMPVPESKRKK